MLDGRKAASWLAMCHGLGYHMCLCSTTHSRPLLYTTGALDVLPPWQLSSMVKYVQPCACMNTAHLGIVLATTPAVRDWLPGWSKHASIVHAQ